MKKCFLLIATLCFAYSYAGVGNCKLEIQIPGTYDLMTNSVNCNGEGSITCSYDVYYPCNENQQ